MATYVSRGAFPETDRRGSRHGRSLAARGTSRPSAATASAAGPQRSPGDRADPVPSVRHGGVRLTDPRGRRRAQGASNGIRRSANARRRAGAHVAAWLRAMPEPAVDRLLAAPASARDRVGVRASPPVSKCSSRTISPEAHLGEWEGKSFEEILSTDEQMLHRVRNQEPIWRSRPFVERSLGPFRARSRRRRRDSSWRTTRTATSSCSVTAG